MTNKKPFQVAEVLGTRVQSSKMITLFLRVVNQLILGSVTKLNIVNSKVITRFRCWPLDGDANMHMNNASYFRVAELARWRTAPESGMLRDGFRNGWMFLVVDQSIVYHKPIAIFQQYVIRTSATFSDDKWVHFVHTLEQTPESVKAGAEPKVFAEIKLRAVMKEKSGKTVPMSKGGLMKFYQGFK